MPDRIEAAARVIADATGTEPGVWHSQYAQPMSPEAVARALDEAGLLAPAPLREERGHRDKTGHVCKCGAYGCPGDTVVRRFVTDWQPVDRSEGTGGKAVGDA